MRCLVMLCALIAVAFAAPSTIGDVPTALPAYHRGCMFIFGNCTRHCEVGTHVYTNDCGPFMPEATCDVPVPVQETHSVCDFSACYCDPGTVRDTKTKKCVKLEDCSK
ncbi:uncharacterized protein LOC105841582 [Bombyx mori]|uniref:Uncharacterized protein n=1 Tax=Bombyx mori TaxID=7091 RepID=A0A8R2C5X5_BOMMO|nr:uncharacterized protein LOC105841582 [Bombyx mori]